MEAVSWSPPVPSGEAAIAAWRNLDRRTRRELLQGMGPHPDPFVAGVAVGYARTKLQSRMPSRLLLVADGLFVLLAAVSFAVVFLAGVSRVLAYVPPAVMALAMLVIVVVGRRFRLGLIRMENVNASRLPAGQPPMPVLPAATSMPLRVTYHWRITALLRLLEPWRYLYFVAFLPSMMLHWTVGFMYLDSMVFVLSTIAYDLVRLPGVEVLVVDGDGVRFGGNTLPWAAIFEVHIHHEKRSGYKTSQVIAFICAEEAITVRTPGRRLWNAGEYGSPFVLKTRGLERSAEEIAAMVTSVHPVPVRNFDPWGG